MRSQIAATALAVASACPALTVAQTIEYKVLATSKTSTMQKEMREAAEAGYRFVSAMGGETSFGGSEVVVLMQKVDARPARFSYRLLATSKTSTMQKELQAAADAGYEYVGQTIFESLFGGQEVTVILERDKDVEPVKYEYKLIATSKTSTLQKEITEAGKAGFQALGMTVAETAMGGSEVVVITRREVGRQVGR
jgi:DNA-binding protein YbaB